MAGDRTTAKAKNPKVGNRTAAFSRRHSDSIPFAAPLLLPSVTASRLTTIMVSAIRNLDARSNPRDQRVPAWPPAERRL